MRRYFLILLIMVSIFSNACKSVDLPKLDYYAAPFDLQFLSSLETSSKSESGKVHTSYSKIQLQRITTETSSEFWRENTNLISLPNGIPRRCFLLEVFKANFLLISEGSCGAASPDLVERRKVIIIDLNTLKKYKADLGSYLLTRSQTVLETFYYKSNSHASILDFNLTTQKIRLNHKKGTALIDMVPQNDAENELKKL